MASRQVNNTSRDIKRRLDIITKKCTELKALGVSTALVYSTSKTNGLYILGDPRITKVIEDHQDEILLNPDWMDGDGDNSYTESVKLAPLPAQLSILNGLTMKCVLRGILKDFGLTFKSRKPAWWPTHIPFESVTTAPEGFEGNWSDGLREILENCYNHHGLDPESYYCKDPEDKSRDRSFLPEELRSRPPPATSPASKLLPDPRGKRLRSDGDELEEDNGDDYQSQGKRQKGYNPYSDEPTPLAIRRKRRK